MEFGKSRFAEHVRDLIELNQNTFNFGKDLIAYDEEVEIELINKDPDNKLYSIIEYIANDARDCMNEEFDFRGVEYIDHFNSISKDEIRGFCQEHLYYKEWAHLTVTYVDFNKLMRMNKRHYERTAYKILSIYEYYHQYIETRDELERLANPSSSEQMQNLERDFKEICDEQERLYRPEFETVFATMIEIDEKQKLYYKTDVWDMSYKLPDTPDFIPIDVALKKTGFIKDIAFCADFKRYCTITLKGKKIMQQQSHIKAIDLNAQIIRVKGWIFKPITICAPGDIQKKCIDKLYETAVITKTPNKKLSEYLDSIANTDVFEMKCNLVPYIDKLKQYNIIGGKNSFLNEDKTLVLFKSLNTLITNIKDNTNKPYKIQYIISDFLKKFDKVKVWGLIMQIIILEGLYDLLSRLDINNNDPGYNEANSLYVYIAKELEEKELSFCILPYGPKDLKRLEPFCDFLMNTEIGQFIQKDFIHEEGSNVDSTCLNEKHNTPCDVDFYFKTIREATPAQNWENSSEGRFIDIEGVGDYRFIPSTIGPWWNTAFLSNYKSNIISLPVVASGLIPQYIRWESEKEIKQLYEDYYQQSFLSFKIKSRSNIKLMMKTNAEIEMTFINKLQNEEYERIVYSISKLSQYLPNEVLLILKDVGNSFVDLLKEKLNSLKSSYSESTSSIEKKTNCNRILPEALNTEKARKYFPRAIKMGLMDEDYRWKDKNIKLAFICSKIYDNPRPISELERFFDVKNLAASITQSEFEPKRSDVISWHNNLLNSIFFD